MLRAPTQTSVRTILETSPVPFDALTDAVRALPPHFDVALGSRAVLTLYRLSPFWFARAARTLPVPLIEAVRQGLTEEPRTAVCLYLLEATRVPETLLEARWTQALAGLNDLQTTYGWKSPQRRKKIRALAQGPLLEAIQASVVGATEPFGDMLAVLAAAGDEASVDALLPHFARAEADGSRVLDQLRQLRVHAAPTPSLEAMFEAVEARLRRRNDESPALAFARRQGLEVERLGAVVWVSSVQLNRGARGVPLYQSHLSITSRAAEWFEVSVSHVPANFLAHATTRFGAGGLAEDALHLGACQVDELPGWYARAAATLGTRWNWQDAVLHSSLRGKKRTAFLTWLEGG